VPTCFSINPENEFFNLGKLKFEQAKLVWTNLLSCPNISALYNSGIKNIVKIKGTHKTGVTKREAANN